MRLIFQGHVVGAQPLVTDQPPLVGSDEGGGGGDALLLESGDNLQLESGDNLLLE